MRTYGMVFAPDGSYTWQEVDMAADGSNDMVWVTTLIQVLKLNLGESPFYANYGIPAKQSVLMQIAPDFYVNQTQQQFASKFAALLVSRQEPPDPLKDPTPIYAVNVTTNQGVKINATIPV